LPAEKPYIAAKFEASRLQEYFRLGDKGQYGSYMNRPLDRDYQYRVFLRAYTVETVCMNVSPSLV